MLKTLLKHELRATAKTFMWLYIAFAAIAVVSAVIIPWSPFVSGSSSYYSSSAPEFAGTFPAAMQGLVFVLYVLAVIAIGVVTIVVIILRFYRNLLGDEGYLMMTLPVSREEHILSKLLVAMIWSICSAIIIFLSIVLFIAASGVLGDVVEALNEIVRSGAPLGRWITLSILTMIVSTLSSILILYASMAIGPNLIKNRVGGSILAFIMVAIASQVISTVIMFAWSMSMDSRNVYATSIMWGVSDGLSFADNLFNATIGASLLSCGIIAVACWFLTQYMMKKKLNLA